MPQSSNDVVVRFLADTSNLLKGIASADKALGNMGKSIGASMAGLASTVAVAGAVIASATGVMVTNATKDAVKFEALMDNISSQLGDNANDFADWQNRVGTSLGYSKLEGAELGSSLNNMFAGIADSQQDLFAKTTKMMEVAAIIRSKTGRSMEDVSNRIRSAMNQEADGAEELGLDVRVSAITASKAFQTMADGKPWEDLSRNQQKAILYNYILETSARQYGDEIANNTSLKVQQFSATLGNLKLAFGQAFLPVLNVVLPILTTFANALIKVMNIVSAFMAGLFGYDHQYAEALQGATEDQTSAIEAQGDALEENTKKKKENQKADKGFLASFDEVHTIPKKDEASESGGGGKDKGDGIQPFTPSGYQKGEGRQGRFVEELTELAEKAKELGEKIKNFLEPVGKAIKEFLGETIKKVREWWEEDGDMIMKAVSKVWDFIKPIFMFLVEMIWGDIKHAIDGLVGFFTGLVTFVSALITGDWSKAWEGFKEMIFGALEAIWGIVNLLFYGKIIKGFGLGFKAIADFFIEFGTKSKTLWDDILTKLKDFAVDIWEKIVYETKFKLLQIVEFLKTFSKNAFDNFISKIKDIAGWIEQTVIIPLRVHFEALKKAVGEKADDMWELFKKPFLAVGRWFGDNVITPLKTKFEEVKKSIGDKGEDAWEAFKKPFVGAYNWFKTNVVDKLRTAFDNIVSGFRDEGLMGGIKALLNSAIDYLNSFIRGFNNLKDKVPFLKKLGDIPTIPRLANGGITNGKTLAMVGDNVGGKEVIAPLDRLNGIIANTLMSALQFGGVGGQSANRGDVVINIDGRQFARVIQPYTNLEQNRVGTNIRLNTI